MTASVSRRLNVLWIMIKIIDFPLKNLFTWYYLKTLRVDAWVHETSLTTPRSMKYLYQGKQVSGQVCVLGVSILPLSTLLIYNIKIVLTVRCLFLSYLIIKFFLALFKEFVPQQLVLRT